MAVLTEGLPVFFIPKQNPVAPVRDDVVNNSGGYQFAGSPALNAQRMFFQKNSPGLSPVSVVSTYIRATAKSVRRPFLPVIFAVDALFA